MKQLLEANNIETSFPYGKKSYSNIVDGVSLKLNYGEIVGLVGESGSGKSMTSMSLIKLIMPPGAVKGDLRIDGVEGNVLEYGIYSDEIQKVRGGKIGMIFQEPMTSLNPIMTVGKQISENIKLHLKADDVEAKKMAIEMMEKVGIANPEIRYDQYPAEFSGGMRQRVMIAMVLAAKPDILIADEATTALDVTTQAQILELIQDISKNDNVAVIIVTHNLGLVARYADRIYVMYGGNIVESGDTEDVFSKPSHPYTRGLLAAVPRLDSEKDKMLQPIYGVPPKFAGEIKHCKFYDRCNFREDICKEENCDLVQVGDGHFSRCRFDQNILDEKQKVYDQMIKKVPEKNILDEACLEVKDLQMIFPVYKGVLKRKIGEVHAVQNVNFKVNVGETLGIVGESGCGKSTLAKCIMHALTPNSGQILYKGTDVIPMKGRALKQYHSDVTMIFQDPVSSLDPRQTAGYIVGEPLITNKLVKNKAEYNKRVEELLRIVGLDPEYKNRLPREFSGGQRQRLGIARALASDPQVIVCDEPVSALDVSIQAQIINLLEELQAKLNITYIFIAHDISVVKHISDRIMVMYLGNVVEVASAETLYKNPLHPYTKALLSAVPIADPKLEATRDRIKLQGEVPSVLERSSGCPFCDRCPSVQDKCRAEKPELKENSKGQLVACFLYED